MKCSRCGAEAPKKLGVCLRCGASLDGAQPRSPDRQNPKPAQQSKPKRQAAPKAKPPPEKRKAPVPRGTPARKQQSRSKKTPPKASGAKHQPPPSPTSALKGVGIPILVLLACVLTAGIVFQPGRDDPGSSSLPSESAGSRSGITVRRPPQGTDRDLSTNEIRYCLLEEHRIDELRSMVRPTSQGEVSFFKAQVEDFNSRCAEFQYRPNDLLVAQQSLESLKNSERMSARDRILRFRASQLSASENSSMPSATSRQGRANSPPSPTSRELERRTARELQSVLSSLKYEVGPIDGQFGEQSLEALNQAAFEFGLELDPNNLGGALRRLSQTVNELSASSPQFEDSLEFERLSTLADEDLQSIGRGGNGAAYYVLADRQLNTNDEEGAAIFLEQALNQNFTLAASTLGYLHLARRLRQSDPRRGLELSRLAAEFGDPAALNNVGLAYQNGIGAAPNPTEAAKFYRLAAKQGYALALYNLAGLYEQGEGVPSINMPFAIDLYEEAHELLPNRAAPPLRLGMIYYYGLNVEEDHQAALRWLEKASAIGDPEADYFIGEILCGGDGPLATDCAKGLIHYLVAADAGDPAAMMKAGFLYFSDLAGQQNFDQARMWFSRASQAGEPFGHVMVASLLAPEDEVQARDRAALAYENEDASDYIRGYARYLVGAMYYGREGALYDLNKAFVELRAAANLDIAEANYELYRMYSRGEGVREDDEMAVRYLARAAESGDTRALDFLIKAHESGEYRLIPQDDAKAERYREIRRSLGEDTIQQTVRRLLQ